MGTNIYHDLVSNKLSFGETNLHHEMEGSTSMLVNGKVNKFTAFIEVRGNPFLVSNFFYDLGFSSRTFVNHRTAGEG